MDKDNSLDVFWATDIDSTCYSNDCLHLTIDSVLGTDFRLITNRADYAAEPIFRSFFATIPSYYPVDGTGIVLPESAYQTGTVRKKHDSITYAAAFSPSEKDTLLDMIEEHLHALQLIEVSTLKQTNTKKEMFLYKVFPDNKEYDSFISHPNNYYNREKGLILINDSRESRDGNQIALHDLQELIATSFITKFTLGFDKDAKKSQLNFADTMRRRKDPISSVVENSMLHIMAENQDKGEAYKFLAGTPRDDRIEFWSGDNNVDTDAALEVLQRENGIVFSVGGYKRMFNEYSLWNKERLEIFEQHKQKIVNVRSPEFLAAAIMLLRDEHNAFSFLGRNQYQGVTLERMVGI